MQIGIFQTQRNVGGIGRGIPKIYLKTKTTWREHNIAENEDIQKGHRGRNPFES